MNRRRAAADQAAAVRPAPAGGGGPEPVRGIIGRRRAAVIPVNVFRTAHSEQSTTRTRAIGALVLAGVVLPAVFAGSGRALPGGSGPGQARPDQPRSVHAAPPLRAVQDAKLDSQLGSVARTAAANGDAAAAPAAETLGLDTVGTGVRVVVDAADPLAAAAAVAAAGGTVEASAGRCCAPSSRRRASPRSPRARRSTCRPPAPPARGRRHRRGRRHDRRRTGWQAAGRTGAGVKVADHRPRLRRLRGAQSSRRPARRR